MDKEAALDMEWRAYEAHLTMEYDQIERGILVVLLREPGAWSVRSLAEYLRAPRSSVQRRVRALVADGLLGSTAGGCHIHDSDEARIASEFVALWRYIVGGLAA